MKHFILLLTLLVLFTGCAQKADLNVPATLNSEPARINTNAPTESDAVSSIADVSFSAQYVRTNGGADNIVYPVVTLIRSSAELEEYYQMNKETYYLESREPASGFAGSMHRYDDAYFEHNALVLVLLEEPSGSISHEVTDVTASADGLTVFIDRRIPQMGTDDMAEWHLFIELAAEDLSENVFVKLSDVNL